jgi:DNA invertase Pin-like site-specific DNA recombinase
MLAAIAEFERELIRERTGEGRKRALANGLRFGRKPKLSDFQRQEAMSRRGQWRDTGANRSILCSQRVDD